jgi:hypothetical protein
MRKLTDITAPQHRCSIGACPAVYTDLTPAEHRCDIGASCPAVLDDDSGSFVFIGKHLDPVPEELSGKVGDTEAAVRLPRDLVLSSLGVTELVEQAELLLNTASQGFCGSSNLDALRSIINRIKGGVNG